MTRSKDFKLILIAILVYAIFFSASYPIYAVVQNSAFDTAFARAEVVPTIGMRIITDLDFGRMILSNGPQSIKAGEKRFPGNATILISGQRNMKFNIAFPQKVTLITGSGLQEVERIDVKDFTAVAERGSFAIGEGGQTKVYIGATRAAIHPQQAHGRYSSTFTATLQYE